MAVIGNGSCRSAPRSILIDQLESLNSASGDCSVVRVWPLVARQPVRCKRKNSAKKKTLLLCYFTTIAGTSLQVEVDSKKSTSLRGESK